MKRGSKNLNVLGIVGARSGSKSIPHKNIKPLLGKPLMAWVIAAAKKSKYLTRLILSTDSEKYAKIGKKLGIEVPFIRPQKYAGDSADDISYLAHAVAWLEKNDGWKADIIVRLIPTTPLCKTESIDACIKLLIDDSKASSARTIAPAPKHPYKLWRIVGNELKPFIQRKAMLIDKKLTGFSEPSNMARQLLPPAYAHVDVIAVRYNTLMKDQLLTGKRIRYVMLEKNESIDIDTGIDFLLAELLLKRKLESKSMKLKL
ncbi:hypothetical protein A2696_02930 [Candidatus Curtissbacteria bacterium RIFCSPHIGHO2_01_FULL_41_13]|uniref:Acylneuraminate cytidylyltransferase n=1 Tax=Candidatus Curtissbacteria bacterium RIFCSPHIGHO2_01_FULL_41_13 TaxID=1797745 RepID=A0A1F5G022_9BACT|nr:MAG: hypothetical protein A2696_02930 [Candidatus Curtissbacteria bacterium RIFCSPHIGHO2_01_FULL_41_13]